MNLYGGALQVFYLLKGLAGRRDISNTLVCPEGSAISDAVGGYVRSIHAVAMRGDLDVFFLRRLTGIVKRENPDIIHLHSRRGADILGGIAAKLQRRRCVLTRRVDNPEYRFWAGVKYRLYDRVITISHGIRDVLVSEGVESGRIVCVPSAVDAARYKTPRNRDRFREEFGLRKSEVVCGTVAQFIKRKGHRFLLAAIPEILRSCPDTRFLFFGKGRLELELEDMCDHLGIGDRVIFAGYREDLDEIFGCLDLLIHPALMEGLGVSLLQGAAAGVPIVGTRVGGIPEIVRDGVNGYLVPPADTPALVEAAARILLDGDLARRMGASGQKLVEDQFSIESMVEGNLEVYRSLMCNNS